MFLDLNNPEQAHIDQRLRSDIIVWLNSVRPNGSPHSVAVWFGWDGESVLIFSKPNNQKLRNIARNPNVILALDDTKDGEDVIAIEGTAELLPQKTLELMDQSYIDKYASRMKNIGWAVAESMAAEYSEVIRITPKKFIS
jgi:PPOX class probable F420-dependent enzyme